ncbi:GH92 family glycosyl hydrolase [Fimbriimonas ginsengisoli]|nr:GH92 family glycosyl hydrolase [Fimbriimonas ginsengisoli]
MRRLLSLGFLLTFTTTFASGPADFADPLVGTDGHGHAFPGALVPFGMVQLSPDTRTDTWDGSSGYHYSDRTILGFSHTHLSGTGVGCLGDIMLMPTVGDLALNEAGYSSPFSHKREVAKPGYYRVFLEKPKVTAELTATARAGFHRYTFPKSDHSRIVLDLLHGVSSEPKETYLKVVNGTTLTGYRKSGGWGGDRVAYFAIRFSRPFDLIEIEQDGALRPGAMEAKGKVKAAINYRTKAGEPILVKVGISATGMDGAMKNLDTEVPGWSFTAVRQAAEKKWNDVLGAVQIQSRDPKVRRTFYSNAYLSYVAPSLFNDVDGAYLGMDHKVHRAAKFQNYTTFSLWDTYRALHPLLTLTQPKRVADLTSSLLAEYRESGLHTTPIWPLWGNETWCMIGYHSVPVLVDAYVKGLLGPNAEAVYRAMRDTSMQNYNGLNTYRSLGYVASTAGGQATSKTIEYSVDDWCLARMASSLGHKEDADLYYQRAANYRNHFDRTTRFMRGRKANGAWRAPFDTRGLVGDEYTEADAWQYGFAVQHDIPGLISLYGGDAKFVQRMDEMFTMDSRINTNIPDITGLMGQYAQGNEQCHHQAYLYDYAGAPWKTQARVRKIMAAFYNDTPAGQIGNNDCGQMSAWYVFSALGFYPVNPANGVYAIGSPAVDQAKIRLDGGRSFTVVAENNGSKNPFVQSATLNGKPFNRCWIGHQEILKGGTLKLVMGPKPNKFWGAALSARPLPTMPAGFRYAALPTPSSDKPVALKLPIRVVCGEDDTIGNFVPDPKMIEGMTNRTDTHVDTSAPNAAPARVYQSERYGQDFTYRFPVPTGRAYTVRLHFAEVFGDVAGQRVENISINGRPVLTNFDPVVAAGGPNRAVVKEFADVRPGRNGQITIRIQAAKNSPDQNAKISAIEIL